MHGSLGIIVVSLYYIVDFIIPDSINNKKDFHLQTKIVQMNDLHLDAREDGHLDQDDEEFLEYLCTQGKMTYTQYCAVQWYIL